jgi:hypothetical protein
MFLLREGGWNEVLLHAIPKASIFSSRNFEGINRGEISLPSA